MVVWASAWLHGRAASDDALDALLVWGELQEAVATDQFAADALGVPLDGRRPMPPAQLLSGLRGNGAPTLALALPAPGDVRGLDAGGTFSAAALQAGEAVVIPEVGVGVVPTVPAEGVLRWTAYRLAAPPALEHVGIGEAEHALTDAIRQSAGALAALDVASERPDAHDALRARLRATPRLDWPQGMPGRSLRVLQRADEVAAILALAHADDPGGALSAGAVARRAEALHPLSAAVRAARRAAVQEAVRVFTGAGPQPEPAPYGDRNARTSDSADRRP